MPSHLDFTATLYGTELVDGLASFGPLAAHQDGVRLIATSVFVVEPSSGAHTSTIFTKIERSMSSEAHGRVSGDEVRSLNSVHEDHRQDERQDGQV